MSEEERSQTNRQPLIFGPAERSNDRAIERIRNDLRSGGPTLGDVFTIPPSGDISVAPLPGTSGAGTELQLGGTVNTGGPTGAAAFFYATVATFNGSTQLGTATRSDTGATINYRNTTGRVLSVDDVVLVAEVSPEFLVVAVYSVSGGYSPISFVAPSNIGFPFDGGAVSDGMDTDWFSSFSGISQAARMGFAVDANGTLGFGAGAICAIHNRVTGSPIVVVRNPNTGTSHNLGSIGMNQYNEANIVLEVAGPYLLARGNGYTSGSTTRALQLTGNAEIRVWDQTNGWRNVGTDTSVATYSGFGWVQIGSDYYVTRKTSTSTQLTFTKLDTLTNTTHTLPATAAVLAKGQWMWTSDGRVATASLTPSWTNSYSFAFHTQFSYRNAAITDSGDLVVFRTYPTAGAGIDTYLFDSSQGGPWSETGLFSSSGLAQDGEPQGVNLSQVQAGDGVIGIAGWVRADFVDPTLDSTEYVGAVWVTDGFTGSTILLIEDTSGYTNGTSSAQLDHAFSGVSVNGRTITGIAGGRTSTSGNGFSYVDSYTF